MMGRQQVVSGVECLDSNNVNVICSLPELQAHCIVGMEHDTCGLFIVQTRAFNYDIDRQQNVQNLLISIKLKLFLYFGVRANLQDKQFLIKLVGDFSSNKHGSTSPCLLANAGVFIANGSDSVK